MDVEIPDDERTSTPAHLKDLNYAQSSVPLRRVAGPLRQVRRPARPADLRLTNAHVANTAVVLDVECCKPAHRVPCMRRHRHRPRTGEPVVDRCSTRRSADPSAVAQVPLDLPRDRLRSRVLPRTESAGRGPTRQTDDPRSVLGDSSAAVRERPDPEAGPPRCCGS